MLFWSKILIFQSDRQKSKYTASHLGYCYLAHILYQIIEALNKHCKKVQPVLKEKWWQVETYVEDVVAAQQWLATHSRNELVHGTRKHNRSINRLYSYRWGITRLCTVMIITWKLNNLSKAWRLQYSEIIFPWWLVLTFFQILLIPLIFAKA